jgi:Xaa-Pro aminopeptidase
MASPLSKLQNILKRPILITHQPNLRYFCGFTGTTGVLLVSKRSAWFFTDKRYTIVAKKQLPKEVHVVILHSGDTHTLRRLLTSEKISALEFDPARTTISEVSALKKNLGTKIKAAPSAISFEEIRAIKTPREISIIRKACHITAKIFSDLKPKIKLGMTESDIAWKIRELAHKYGSEEMAFDSIIGFGKNSASPHHQTGSTRLRKGDTIQLDFGVSYLGYQSDMSRVLFVGNPSPKMKEIYNEVLASQTNATKEVRSGAATAKIANKYESKMFADIKDISHTVAHGLGHGVGLEIHELPVLKTISGEKLKAGQIVTVEPGIYIENFGGVRIEDTVLVRRNKPPEILTPAPRSLASAILKI